MCLTECEYSSLHMSNGLTSEIFTCTTANFINPGMGVGGMFKIDHRYTQHYLEGWILSKLVDNGDSQTPKVNSGLVNYNVTCDDNVALVNSDAATH